MRSSRNPITLATEPEKVTPRIDSVTECSCRRVLVWDEVFGWLHLATGTPCGDQVRLVRVHAPLHPGQNHIDSSQADLHKDEETHGV